MTTSGHHDDDSPGLVRVTGEDALAFLHAQTTQALSDLAPGEKRKAAWLTARGRVRALFDVVRDGETIWLVTAPDSAEWLAAELGKFILRSDVSLEPANGEAVAVAVGDSQSSALAAIRAGIAEITKPLRDRYVPQMLNLERIDAVSFSKGCYPGQEIVARTENLGEVKRRLVRFACGPGPLPTAGSEVLDSADRAVGEVNRSSATGQGCELLAVIQIDALGDRLTLAADGRELERQPLAYED